MNQDWERRCEQYLDGSLDPEESRNLELALGDPEVGRIFAATVFLRQALEQLGPDSLPEGLLARIQAAVGAAEASRIGSASPAGSAFRWALLWPRAAVPGLSAATSILPRGEKREKKKPGKLSLLRSLAGLAGRG